MRPDPTVREALAAFWAAQGLPHDGGSAARSWRIQVAGMSVTMPNFRWRAQALPVHDLHHVITGYLCTLSGEFEMAAWEFAAGRFRHAGATAFCLPLVGIGALLRPKRTWAAFLRGRGSRTLYAVGLSAELLDSRLSAVAGAFAAPCEVTHACSIDKCAYAALVTVSLAWTLTPVALLLCMMLP